jgi:hypothetical protein
MSAPVRIQRKRAKGWRMPANTVSVTRPGQFGNPYYPGCGIGFGNISAEGVPCQWPLETRTDAVRHFREYIRLMRMHEPRRFFADFVVMTRDTFSRFQPHDRGLFGDNEQRPDDDKVTRSNLCDLDLFCHNDNRTSRPSQFRRPA